MLLESGDSPHVVHAFLNSFIQCKCFMGASDQYHHLKDKMLNDEHSNTIDVCTLHTIIMLMMNINLLGIHNSCYSNCKCLFRHFAHIIVKETCICFQSVLSKSFNTCTRRKRWARLIKCNMAIRPNSFKKRTKLANIYSMALTTKIFLKADNRNTRLTTNK